MNSADSGHVILSLGFRKYSALAIKLQEHKSMIDKSTVAWY